jgi:hypothetical protein
MVEDRDNSIKQGGEPRAVNGSSFRNYDAFREDDFSVFPGRIVRLIRVKSFAIDSLAISKNGNTSRACCASLAHENRSGGRQNSNVSGS